MLGPEYFTEIYILNCNFILWQLYWDRGLQYKTFRLIGRRGVQFFFQRKGGRENWKSNSDGRLLSALHK
jgi:hypothetical protein